MTNQEIEIPEFYAPDDYGRMAEALGIPELSAAQMEELGNAAHRYWIDIKLEIEPGQRDGPARFPSQSKRRMAVERVAKVARRLQAALDDPALYEHRGRWPVPKKGSLEDLASAADETAHFLAQETGERPGGRPTIAGRRNFVRELATLFEECTGHRATRRFDSIEEKECGPFLDFVKAALGPVRESSLTGIENVVREIAAE